MTVTAVPSQPQTQLLTKRRISQDTGKQAAWEPTTTLPFLFLHPHRALQPLKIKDWAGPSAGEVSTFCPPDLTMSHSPRCWVGSRGFPAGGTKALVLISDERVWYIYSYPHVSCTLPCAPFSFQGVSSNTLFFKSRVTEPLQEQINKDFLNRRVSHEKFIHNFSVQSRQTSDQQPLYWMLPDLDWLLLDVP